MFTELLPVLKDRTVMLTIALVGDRTVRVNVIPRRKTDKETDTAENALTAPLTVTATADELDRDFATQVTAFTTSFIQLATNLGAVEAAHRLAVKALAEEKKQELNGGKRKVSGSSARTEAQNEAAPAPPSGKPVFGSKSQSQTTPSAQSLFEETTAAAPQEAPAEVTCEICRCPILPGQQRHPLMPMPAHASSSDCEAARRSSVAAAT